MRQSFEATLSDESEACAIAFVMCGKKPTSLRVALYVDAPGGMALQFPHLTLEDARAVARILIDAANYAENEFAAWVPAKRAR